MVRILQTYMSEESEFEVVGEAQYQSELLAIVGGKKTEESVEFDCTALLIHDDDNRYDPRAVAVVINRKIVGYLPRDDTDEFHDAMSHYGTDLAVVAAEVRGGWKRPTSEGHFGVVLYVDWPLTGEVIDR